MGFPFYKLKHSHKNYLQWDPVRGFKVTFILDWFVLGVSASLHLHIAQHSNSTTSGQPSFLAIEQQIFNQAVSWFANDLYVNVITVGISPTNAMHKAVLY